MFKVITGFILATIILAESRAHGMCQKVDHDTYLISFSQKLSTDYLEVLDIIDLNCGHVLPRWIQLGYEITNNIKDIKVSVISSSNPVEISFENFRGIEVERLKHTPSVYFKKNEITLSSKRPYHTVYFSQLLQITDIEFRLN